MFNRSGRQAAFAVEGCPNKFPSFEVSWGARLIPSRYFTPPSNSPRAGSRAIPARCDISSNNDSHQVVHNERPHDPYDFSFDFDLDFPLPDAWYPASYDYPTRDRACPHDALALYDPGAVDHYPQSQSPVPLPSEFLFASSVQQQGEAGDQTTRYEDRDLESFSNFNERRSSFEQAYSFAETTAVWSSSPNLFSQYPITLPFQQENPGKFAEDQPAFTVESHDSSWIPQGNLLQNGPNDCRSIFSGHTSPTSREASLSSITQSSQLSLNTEGLAAPSSAKSLSTQDDGLATVCQCQWSLFKKAFVSTSLLHKHVTAHADESHVCHWSACGICFQSGGLLNKHIQNHTKPFRCPEAGCKHSSAKSRDLRRHMLTHGLKSGNKIFCCPSKSCEHGIGGSGEPFKRLDHAKRHIKRQHSDLVADPITMQL